MALLSRRVGVLGAHGLGALVLCGCAQSAPLGHVEVWLSDDGGEERRVAAQAFIDPDVSRYAPHGFYAYFELPRADGSVGIVELDVPTDQEPGAPLAHYDVSYRELSDDRVRFSASEVHGQLVVPSSAGSDSSLGCACEDRGFALTFVDRDGEQRHMQLGRMGWSEEFCRPMRSLSVSDGLRVERERCAPEPKDSPDEPARSSDRDSSADYDDCAAYDCDDPVLIYDDGGCDSDDYDDSEASGCSGTSEPYTATTEPAPVSSSPDSGAGCEGDSASSSEGACEGDSVDQDDDEEPTTCAVAPRSRRMQPARAARPTHSRALLHTGLPLLCAVLVLAARARRLRARARRGFAQSAQSCHSPTQLDQ